MNVKKMVWRILAVIALAGLMVGCASPTPTVAPTAVATVDFQPTINAIKTQSAVTVIANLTQNAPSATPVTPTQTPLPTATLAPTSTPLPPATATATFVPWTLTPTQTAYSCTVTDYSPKSTFSISPSGNFDASWVVKNNGSQKWLAPETDVRYVDGTKMQKSGDILDLSTDVAPNDSYTVAIDMVAPTSIGTYTAHWQIITGKYTICILNLSVVVK